MLRLANHAFGDGHGLFLQHTAAQQLVCFVASRLGDNVVGFVKIDGSDVAHIRKVKDVDGLVLLHLGFLEVLVRKGHIPSWLDLKALDDIIDRDLFPAVGADFFVFHP